MSDVYVLVIEHADEDAELYVFASYANALARAAKEIADRLPEDQADDDDAESEVRALLVNDDQSSNARLETAVRFWNEDATRSSRIHIEQQPILDQEEPADGRTLFTCRTCDRAIWGKTDGTFDHDAAGAWARIEGIDGPDAICPDCQKDSGALDALRADGYPNARVKAGAA